MKRIPLIPILLILVLAGCGRKAEIPVQTQDSYQKKDMLQIWVAPDGQDLNTGGKDEPLQTLPAALRMARELRRVNDPGVKEGIEIILRDGVYALYETLMVRPEDSGSESSPTIIRAENPNSAILSGGRKLKGWSPAKQIPTRLPKEAAGKIWSAEIPEVWGKQVDFRQLWVNGKKADRASNLDEEPLKRILSLNKEKEEMYIPAPAAELLKANRLEFIIHQWWAIANLRVRNLVIQGDSAIVTFYQPESKIEFEHPWPAPFIDENKEYNGNSAFYLANDIALLNRPGEWCCDYGSGMIYYWPREDENMNSAEVVFPVLETLVRMAGSLDAPVSNIHFVGLGFEHTTWMRPSLAGHVPLQAGMYITDAYKLNQPGTPDKASLENQAWIGRQPAGMELVCATGVSVRECHFMHMAATGLDLVRGTHHNTVEGNLFSDIGGTGIQLGFFGDESYEAHIPYNPTDKRELCHNERIANNLITDCTNEDWGCVGISAGFANHINIEFNEVSHVNYSGICIGWGWTKTVNSMENNRVHGNYIHHFAKQMYDVGGIYTLSAQPGTVISNNYIEHLEKAPYAHIPEHYQYIYFDEGSSYIKAIDNWTEKDKFFSNTPGPGNEWINNGPDIADKNQVPLINGIQNEYRDLFDLVESKDQK